VAAGARRAAGARTRWGTALPPWAWNLCVVAVLVLAVLPEYALAHRLALAFQGALAWLLRQTDGNIPPGSIPAADFGLILLAFLLEIAALKWAQAGIAATLGQTGRLPFLPLLCLLGALAFATGLAQGLAGVLAGVFALVVLFEVFTSAGGLPADPGAGLHGPRGSGR